mmetsp:Transcript_23735/g.36614  ORF Transcript_23735/g.36614 Transcript_23735/m.36614 type:complete len:119 (+) Transcript_23735:302-658(+)
MTRGFTVLSDTIALLEEKLYFALQPNVRFICQFVSCKLIELHLQSRPLKTILYPRLSSIDPGIDIPQTISFPEDLPLPPFDNINAFDVSMLFRSATATSDDMSSFNVVSTDPMKLRFK